MDSITSVTTLILVSTLYLVKTMHLLMDRQFDVFKLQVHFGGTLMLLTKGKSIRPYANKSDVSFPLVYANSMLAM